MPCYSPVTGYRARSGRNENGKWPIVFNIKEGYSDLEQQVPCGRCIGCRLERSRQWAVRCMHEATQHENNCFITLTYSPEHLPKDKSVNVTHFQKFMKRFRKKFGDKIRFFHCGEYGTTCQNCGLSETRCKYKGCDDWTPGLGRPHYHAIIFNFDFPDREIFKTERGVQLDTSKLLNKLWPFGFSSIGNVTFESAAYVARYVTKKITGPKAEDHYNGLKPEYITMSRRPGIGKQWFDKYKTDVYPSDKIVVRQGFICKPPRYYDTIYDIEEPEKFKKVQLLRQKKARLQPDETPERLLQREKCKILQTKSLKRKYEEQ